MRTNLLAAIVMIKTCPSMSWKTDRTDSLHTLYLPGRMVIFLVVVTTLAACQPSIFAAPNDGRIDFVTEVRPILSDHCFACHGPDAEQRTTEFRLDQKESAFSPEFEVIIAGDAENSLLIQRINSTDPDEVMPPPDHLQQLSDEQKSVLTTWIEEGAEWAEHWSFVAPADPEIPQVEDREWPRNDIDRFVLAKLESLSIHPAREAEPHTLLRRLSFDLIGLPPSVPELRSFETDVEQLGIDKAYEKAVDRLLASPHFGERMAVYWLDLVRYADSVGYHGDQPVSVSPYRDYVIEALNRNLPFDQFTREQLAGDLLDTPTTDQKIASGYNRLGMMSAEGGVQPEEYLVKYAADRVRTTGSVWLGLTLGCCECHDHKFDPISTKEFYEFSAFFADIKEKGLYAGANRTNRWGPTIELADEALPDLLAPIDTEIERLKQRLAPTIQSLAGLNAWEQSLKKGNQQSTDIPKEIKTVLEIPQHQRTKQQSADLYDFYTSVAPEFVTDFQRLKELNKQRAETVDSYTRTSLITVSVPPRPMRVLPRGNWMDQSGPEVSPGVPRVLGSLKLQSNDESARATRLDLAEWIVDDANPLTARVLANRIWRLFFGAGLSTSLDDLGAQGQPPSHPQLLDHLAQKLKSSGWNIKSLVRTMVTSSTYRQSSAIRPELQPIDPENRWLARQARFRLDAEFIRDQALATSGLLNRMIGGESVYPYQPVGLYRHLNFPTRKYKASQGPDQYRRGVYTHWQRQYLHPAMKTFDAPPREECTAARPQSSTPLAALLMLNDPSYVEAARAMAVNAIQQTTSTDDRLANIFLTCFSRSIQPAERQTLVELLKGHRAHFEQHSDQVRRFLSVGQFEVPEHLDSAEVAAWTSVCRVIMNMHEFIIRK
jgi:mono/diheme cytochrome c family protein